MYVVARPTLQAGATLMATLKNPNICFFSINYLHTQIRTDRVDELKFIFLTKIAITFGVAT